MSSQTLALCIPAYNAGTHLPRLLDSARKQTCAFDEILVYDDCSSDDTAVVASQFDVLLVRGDINSGCAFGRNVLAEKTSCEWVHFHDADDALYPNFVEQARNWMEDESTDVVLFGFDWVDDLTGKKLDTRHYDHEALTHDPIAFTLAEQIQSICGVYRRDRFLQAGGYDVDPEVLYNEDVAMHCQLARFGLRFAADPAVTVINYRRANSMSAANQVKCSRAHYEVLRKSAAKLDSKYADVLAEQLWRAAGVSATYLDWTTADMAAELAMSLKGRVPARADLLFKALCFVEPHLALRAREYLIRIVKPRYRKGVQQYLEA